jgi:hypothetical protein
MAHSWPGRYASILADDPGAGVLSVTPLGMTLRSDGGDFGPSRVVALWSEPGLNETLTLGEGKHCIVLSLKKEKEDQWTADGRKSKRTALKYFTHISI